ncbi:MAG TPA: sterol desaturase family protein [Chitinophagales bacterium]|nr:sterol desaturase family protein [Chitinophagales bacterium]
MDFLEQFLHNPIKYSIPVFFLLIGIELLVDRRRKLHLYRFNDAITNLSCGIGQQVIGIFMKVFTVGAYAWLYEFSPFKGQIPTTWWSVLLLFIGVDFFYYWFHRLAHEIAVLWGSHVVHHQSEEYNLTVAVRQAWLQGAFSWVFYLPLALLGFEPLLFVSIAGFQTLYQFWIHTKTIGKLPAPIEFIFNTPSHHRVHHGVNPKYIDRNHGGTLIIFDRMFGTFQAEEEKVVYGITKPANSWNPLWVNFEYWLGLFKDALTADRWSDKARILFKQPGWYPDALGGVQQPKEVTPETFHKYNTRTPRGLNRYVLLHFALLLPATIAFLFKFKDFSFGMNVGLTGLIIFTLVNLGGILEGKRWVFTMEIVRLLALTSAIGMLMQGNPLFLPAVFTLLLLVIASVIWLGRYRWMLTDRQEKPGRLVGEKERVQKS